MTKLKCMTSDAEKIKVYIQCRTLESRAKEMEEKKKILSLEKTFLHI